MNFNTNNIDKEVFKKHKVKLAYLFGSQAKGASHKYSDIDMAVISSKFVGMNELKRIKLLLDCAHQIKYDLPFDIETFGYTPQEYINTSHFDFLGVIKETGKVIYG